ncbi:ankyrin repeat and sterile alpha motif domain-containing protein 1B-like [Centruroides sculpturatus]|uniref:ankyrin repeat and sterile alpha motif domain-containing protein 1B-like n=1 Tax=Centruroides sculpturatus TaxID=218467 RepID=UPI000C6CC746|nr:ankyrin repeat and sterile alpha motif domain-containing protein 1B-like [Centruroides sculpturatus]
MGKEQELIEAARSGNILVVERILSQRAKKTGPLASLRRGPGANAQDQSGYTSLHHAALNGHKEIVSLLLQYEASTNVVDHKGSTPLHLAAWTGNTEIVKILLEQGPSVPNVNLANHDQETPLHSAAQYGHTEVVALLLKHNSNPSVRNIKEESPLDLAAQYGRLETVELLVNRHPHLIQDRVKKHSPLHLASRNGHKQVVKVLLDAGFEVNYLTNSGTSLHEAALYGKVEVVKLLLDAGIDTSLQDGLKRTVYDLLKDLNTNIARQTYKIIKGHVTPEDEGTEVSSNLSSPHGFLPSPYGSSGSYGTSPPRMTRSPLSEINHIDGPIHQYKLSMSNKRSSAGSGNDAHQTSPVLLSKSLDSTLDKASTGSCTPSGSMNSPIQAPHAFRDVTVTSSDTVTSLSPSTMTSSEFSDIFRLRWLSTFFKFFLFLLLGHVTPEDEGTEVSSNLSSPHGFLPSPYGSSGSYGTSPPRMTRSPLSEINHIDGPIHQYKLSMSNKRSSAGSGNDAHQTSPVLLSKSLDSTLDKASTGSCTPSGSMNSPIQAPHAFRDPPAKPPRRSIAPVSPIDKSLPTRLSGYSCELLLGDHGPNSGRTSPRPLSDGHHESDNEAEPKKRKGSLDNKNGKITESSPFSALYDDIASGRVTSFSSSFFRYHNSPAVLSRGRQSVSSCEDERPNKPNSLDFRSKRATVQIPLSPTHYQQPPTPDFPPPSPSTAAGGIHEKIRPLSQDDLRLAVYLDSQVNFLKEVNGTEYKRKRLSRDIETLTEEELFATVDPSGNVRVSLRKENKSVSTDTIEEIMEDDPFAGLCRGSVCPLDGRTDDRHPTKRPMNLFQDGDVGTKLKTMTDGGTSDQRSSLSLLSPFDENAEWAEIADIMASFGSGIARESVFAREIEEQFTKTFISSESINPSYMHYHTNGHCARTGLCRGSVCPLDGRTDDRHPTKRPMNLFQDGDVGTKLKTMTDGGTSDQRSSLSLLSPFDENAEWAEIADIMASFGSGIARESVFAREIEEQFTKTFISSDNRKKAGNARGFSTVREWLESLDMAEYENLLMENGFDDVDFLGSTTLDDRDLIEIGVLAENHRQKILNSAKDFPNLLPIGRGEGKAGIPNSIEQWLRSLNLESYVNVFAENEFTELDKLTTLTNEDLLLVRFLLTKHFDDLEDLNLLKMNSLNLYKERNDNKASSGEATSVENQQSIMEIDTKDLKIRPPTQLMGDPTTVGLRSPQQLFQDIPSLFATQWRHQPEVLIRGSCNYSAQYLGSTLVKELKGMESTLRSIQKLKASSRDIGKVPNVILSISHSGVKFIDGRTKQLVCEHEIRNIHCACQDTDDLNHFAYITKEHQTTNHYCHVFRAQNTDVATEIILTLGQAFEVAYQLALKENSTKTASKFVHFLNKSDDQKIEEKKKYVSHITVQLVQKTEKDGDSEDKQSS